MEPHRVKLYGLFFVTKRRYLVQLSVTIGLLLGLLGLWWYLPNVPLPAAREGELPPHLVAASWLLRNLHWLVIGLAILVAAEAILVFRRFSRVEAVHRASQS